MRWILPRNRWLFWWSSPPELKWWCNFHEKYVILQGVLLSKVSWLAQSQNSHSDTLISKYKFVYKYNSSGVLLCLRGKHKPKQSHYYTDVTDNSLKMIPPKAFNNKTHLRSVDASSNRIKVYCNLFEAVVAPNNKYSFQSVLFELLLRWGNWVLQCIKFCN